MSSRSSHPATSSTNGSSRLDRAIQCHAAPSIHRLALVRRRPSAVAVQVGPPVLLPPLVRVRIGIETELCPGATQYRPKLNFATVLPSPVRSTVVPIPGCEEVPRHDGVDGGKGLGDRIESTDRMGLFRQKDLVSIEPQPDVERQSSIRLPRIVRIGRVSPQPTVGSRGRLEQVDLDFVLVAEHVQDVSG